MNAPSHLPSKRISIAYDKNYISSERIKIKINETLATPQYITKRIENMCSHKNLYSQQHYS